MSDLKELLISWKLDKILPHLIDEEIDLDTLAIMKVSHIKSLLCDFSLGTQIRFEHNLEQWRRQLGKPLKHGAHNKISEIIIKENSKIDCTQTSLNETPNIQINLQEILIQSPPEGPELMDKYNKNHIFTQTERSQLIEVIVKYFLKNDINFDLQKSYDLENAILIMFPNERLDAYRKSVKGKIYKKYLEEKMLNKKEELGEQYNHDDKNSENMKSNNTKSSTTNMDMNNEDSEHLLIPMESKIENRNGSTKEPNKILLQIVYRDQKRFIKIVQPFVYEDFFNLACSIFNITNRQIVYVAVNECEVSPDDFKNVILQYYSLPTFKIELKERVTETKTEQLDTSYTQADFYNQTTTYTPAKPFNEHSNTAVQIIVNHLPDANDIRNIPSLLPIVKMSDDGRPLENKHRTAIAKAIIDECLNFQPERVLKRQDFFTLTDNLIQAFPNETASAYFIPSQPNHAARGKLWNAYNNKRSFLGSSGIVQRRQHSNSKRKLHSDEDEGSERTNDKVYITENQIECKEFSPHSILDWDSIKQKWADSHQDRRRELLMDNMTPQYYMQKYSILKTNRGVDLMEIDVNILHPTVAHVNNWLSLHEKVIEMARKQHKMEQKLKIFESIDSSHNEKYRANLALLVLPYIFPYNARRNELNEKVSKLEIQQRFIKEYPTLEDLRSDSDCCDLQIRFVHCNDAITYVEFKICENLFTCPDLLEALNVMFHYTVALNLEYPKTCLHIWQFIQLAIFQIEIQGIKQPNVESTLNDLYML